MTELYRLMTSTPTWRSRWQKENILHKKDGTRGYKTVVPIKTVTKIKKYNKKLEILKLLPVSRNDLLQKVLSLNQYSNVILGADRQTPVDQARLIKVSQSQFLKTTSQLN